MTDLDTVTRRLAWAGAASYGLWGLMHLGLGVVMIASATSGGGPRTEDEAESYVDLVGGLIGPAVMMVAIALTAAAQLSARRIASQG